MVAIKTPTAQATEFVQIQQCANFMQVTFVKAKCPDAWVIASPDVTQGGLTSPRAPPQSRGLHRSKTAQLLVEESTVSSSSPLGHLAQSLQAA